VMKFHRGTISFICNPNYLAAVGGGVDRPHA
jgi:hypothetical protein